MKKEIKIENKGKSKRKISIITVFLWIFLVAIMTIITIGGINKSKALEENEAIVKTELLSSDTVNIGDEVTYKIKVENSTKKITNVVIEDNLSEKLDIISCELNGEEISNYNGRVEISTMESGEIATLIIKATPNSSGEIRKVAILSYCDYGITTVTETTMISNEIVINVLDNGGEEKIRVTKSVSPIGNVYIGDKIRYTIEIENLTDDDIDVDIRDELSPKVEPEYKNLQLPWSYPIKKGRKGSVSFVVIAKEEGEVRNKASIICDGKKIESNEVITNVIRKTATVIVPPAKIKIDVKKVWEDNNNEYGKRPESVVLQLKNLEEVVSEISVSEENNWGYEFEVPKYDEDGNEINYTVDEKETSKYYEKRVEGYTVINKYIGEEEKEQEQENVKDKEDIENSASSNNIDKDIENVDTSDINIFYFISIFIITISVITIINLKYIKKYNE